MVSHEECGIQGALELWRWLALIEGRFDEFTDRDLLLSLITLRVVEQAID